MELGIYTFGEVTPDARTGELISVQQRLQNLIEEVELTRRGLYGGVLGYLDFAGNLDFCIAIRTIILERGQAQVQAGAGIVADSNPTAEYEETRDKARALIQALEMAERGL